VSTAHAAAPSLPLGVLQRHFLTLLPRIELHARVYFRHLKCPGKKEDAVAEVVAVAWKGFLRATAKGKDVGAFVSALAGYAARHVRGGRKVWGKDRRNDVLSPICQQRHGFAVAKLAEVDTLSSNPLNDALADNTRSPVPEQVSFRIDFPAWLGRRSDRDRRVALDLMAGERTLDVADRHGLTPGRVSQLRRDFHDDWSHFCSSVGA
jgi:hypothetical protein